MSSKIIFDEHRMRQTAEAVYLINRRGHSSVDGVLDYMRKTAERTQEREPGYTGYLTVAGFVLTFWYDEQLEMNVFASVDAYTVLKHLGKV